jgi:hypothetical protein
VAGLAEAVARLEARVAALESPAPALTPLNLPGETGLSRTLPDVLPEALPGAPRILGLLGRVCLILGGATFIRALVDAGSLHRGWGVALGLAYALTWAVLADRARSPLEAAFHVLASILITYPLIVESTARFGILAPGLAAVLLVVATGLHGIVAWRRDLQPILWTATLASLASGFLLMAAQRTVEPFVAGFLLLGVGTLWLTYGRRWHGLPWPTALAADLGVLILTSLAAWPGGTPEAYRSLSAPWARTLALALAALYVGSFALRMRQRQRLVNAFEATQTILVLLVGFGGAVRVALATSAGLGLLGAGVSLAGAGCYLAARPFAEDQEETRANFNFFTFLALIFLLLGGPIVLPLPGFALLGGLLGLAAMGVGLRWRRASLILQSGIYLAAALLASGLASWSFRAFLATTAPAAPPSTAGVATFVLLSATLGLFLFRRPEDVLAVRVRPVILWLAALGALALGAVAIFGGGRVLLPSVGDAGLLAVLRTATLSALTLALAWCGRRLPVLAAGWLVYPLLILGALKFLFEDVAVGRPLTLFLAFMAFGATLILAPRLLKTTNVPHPEVDP